MPNEYVNKVELANGTTLIDITDTTAVASDVASGKEFYLATGEKVTGTYTPSIPQITIATGGVLNQTLEPDIFYHFTSESLTSLTLTLDGQLTDQYHFDFISPQTAITLTLPQGVIMSEDFTVEANTKYEIDIYNGYGIFAQWVYEVSA